MLQLQVQQEPKDILPPLAPYDSVIPCPTAIQVGGTAAKMQTYVDKNMLVRKTLCCLKKDGL